MIREVMIMPYSTKGLWQSHLEDMQRLRGLRPIDDDFMRALFR